MIMILPAKLYCLSVPCFHCIMIVKTLFCLGVSDFSYKAIKILALHSCLDLRVQGLMGLRLGSGI